MNFEFNGTITYTYHFQVKKNTYTYLNLIGLVYFRVPQFSRSITIVRCGSFDTIPVSKQTPNRDSPTIENTFGRSFQSHSKLRARASVISFWNIKLPTIFMSSSQKKRKLVFRICKAAGVWIICMVHSMFVTHSVIFEFPISRTSSCEC